jgi:hypothetical protein
LGADDAFAFRGLGGWILLLFLTRRSLQLRLDPQDGDDYTTRSTLALRIGSAGDVAWATNIAGCTGDDSLSTLVPYAMRALEDGTLAVVGGVGTIARAGFFRLRDDGTVSAAAVTKSTGLSTEFLFTDIVELPTGSFVAVGDYTFGFDPTRLIVAGLDIAGRAQWLHAYGLRSAGKPTGHIAATAGFLTDDGGLLALGSIGSTAEGVPYGSFFALKASAKDGVVPLQTSGAERVSQPYQAVSCVPSATKVAVTSGALASTSSELTVQGTALDTSGNKPSTL